MAQGKATDRLNDILTQGSSVKTASAVSVLDKPEPTTTAASSRESTATAFSEGSSPTPLHGDPEVPDISKLLHQNDAPEEDMDAMFQKIFASAGVNTETPQSADDKTALMFAEMIKAMLDENGQEFPRPEDTSYQLQLSVFHAYQQKVWKARFLVLRLILHTFNFFYHYTQIDSFVASPYSFHRLVQPDSLARNFFTIFVSVEIAVITSYFAIMSKNGLLRAFSRDHAILKLISLASGVFPQARQFQPIVDNALVYWSGLSILIGDVMLIVFYFGMVSVFSR